MAWAFSAQAAESVTARLDEIEGDIQAVASRSEEIERQVVPGRGFLTEREAVRRFEEHLYEFMIGEYDRSAEGFFALVTTGALADAGFHRDAEWYLAEALFEMGNWVTAESRFLVIAQDGAHPFRDDAVRRLLELYATSGQGEKFREAYEREIVRGQVRPTDLITYSVGKSFYRAGDLVKAKSYLLEIQPTSPMYNKAMYFVGTVMVVENNLPEAAEYFQRVKAVSVDSSEDRKVLDLALLALGRIYYELGDFVQSAENYNDIGGDSEYLADKLYEIVWTYIKQESFDEALRAVEIFLLAYPEHEYTAQLSLLQGHLNMKEVQFDSALTSYETVIAEYTPLRDRFGELANSADAEYFQRLAAARENGGGIEGDLPGFAIAMMAADAQVDRALDLYEELDRQNRQVTESEEIVEQLTAALDTATSVAGYRRIRGDIALMRTLAVQQRLDLLRIEEDWLWSTTPKSTRPNLEPLRDRRADLVDRILNIPGGDEAIPAYADRGLMSEVDGLAAEYRAARIASADQNARGTGLRFDTAHQSLIATDARLELAGGKIGDLEIAELARIKDRVAYEAGEVIAERADLDLTRSSAEMVAADLTKEGFGKLQAYFADSVLRADLGILDVYWAQKEAAEAIQRDAARRNTNARAHMREGFNRIEQQLPDPVVTAETPEGSR